MNHTMTARRQAPRPGAVRREPIAIVSRVVVALAAGPTLGVALGWWNRRALTGRSRSVAMLAELGAPWIAAAFAAAAVVMFIVPQRSPRPAVAPAVFAGALAGSTCLVAATIVYYGPARTGTLDFTGALSPTAVWSVIGFGVGAIFGGLGTLWRASVSVNAAAAALIVTGAALTSEAYYVLDAVAIDPAGRGVLVGLAITGAALPLLVGVRWQAVAGVVAVALLALPGSLAVEAVLNLANGSLTYLRSTPAESLTV